MTRLNLTSLSCLQVLRFAIPRYELIPNTSIQNRPLLIYKACFPADAGASAVENHLKSVGVVEPQWRYSMWVCRFLIPPAVETRLIQVPNVPLPLNYS